MNNPEKLETYGAQDEEQQSKNTTQYVMDTTMYQQINNINKTWALVKTTGGKGESNIFLCGNRNGHHNTELRT